jgi:hypothetical protein
MSSLVIAGDTSGSVTLQAPAIAGSAVLTLPSTSGNVITSTGGVSPATIGNVLTADGTNWVSSGKLTYATPVLTTSGTSAVISSVPSWAKRITILFNGVTTSATTLVMTLNSISTGYNWTQPRINATGAGSSANTSASSFQLSVDALSVVSGKYTITLANPSTYVYIIDGQSKANTSLNMIMGQVTVGAVLSSITLSGPTFSAGELDVIYE